MVQRYSETKPNCDAIRKNGAEIVLFILEVKHLLML